jgi:hypothetical protein
VLEEVAACWMLETLRRMKVLVGRKLQSGAGRLQVKRCSHSHFGADTRMCGEHAVGRRAGATHVRIAAFAVAVG